MSSDSVNVYIDKDKQGVLHSLDHLQEPYVPQDASAQADAVSVSQQYIKDQAATYDFPESYLRELGTEASAQQGLTNDKTPALRLAEGPKRRLRSTVVSYQQTILGFPVWETGFSVMLDEDPPDHLRVVGSISTAQPNIEAELIKEPGLEAEFLNEISEQRLVEVLGLDATDQEIRINTQRLLVYKFDPETRQEIEDDESRWSGMDVSVPTLELPPVEDSILARDQPKIYYVCREVLFTWRLPETEFGDINWRAFIEVDTGSVLYLRALMASIHGSVYTADPFTRLGATAPSASAPVTELDKVREWKELPAITRASPQELAGRYVRIKDFDPPAVPAPTSPTGNFSFSVSSDEFAAVNAYYQMASLFNLVERLGFNVRELFNSTAPDSQFPLPVDHRGFNNAVNAKAPGNSRGDGSGGFIFGIAAPGTTIGMGCDFRVAAHEFCHALLWDAVHKPGFGFAHSAGDALGSIFCDPTSRHTDRFDTFPWSVIRRRHDRAIADGWAWGGVQDRGGYLSEEILNTSLFRAYRCIGGDDADIKKKRWASRYMLYLIIAGIASLASGSITPTPKPVPYVTAMMLADGGTIMGYPGGAVRKVIRWSFEEQGLYQPEGVPGSGTAVTTRGAPPPVDVYIDDGRSGGYNYITNWDQSTGIWNRRAADSGTVHQHPLRDVPNYCYVRIRNRGTQTAQNVVVSAYHLADNADDTWPAGFESTTTAPISAPAILAGGTRIVGPFEWVPLHNVTPDSLLVAVSALGDRSNIDPLSGLACARGPTDIDKLVPFDNNIGLRAVTTVAPA